MKIERELPTVDIAGTKFVVDVVSRELREVDNPKNRLYFPRFRDLGWGYMFSFDSAKKKLADYYSNKQDVREIRLKPMSELDPFGMSTKYGVSVEFLQGKSDREIMCDPELFAKMLKGFLPVIDIAGDKYQVNSTLAELWSVENRYTTVNLLNLDKSADGERYAFYYNTRTKETFNSLPPDIKKIPDDVLYLEIPTRRDLDPIKFNSSRVLDYKEFIGLWPIDGMVKARVVPWAETDIPRLMEVNNRQQNQQINKSRTKKRRKKH